MNLNISPAMNYSNMNCKRNSNPNFGMAIKFDENALTILKKQALKLDDSKIIDDAVGNTRYSDFWADLTEAIERQKDNAVNIIVRKAKGRDALVAEVVDERIERAVPNSKFSQPLIGGNADMRFLNEAEIQADKIKDVNARLDQLDIAEKADYKPHSSIDVEA